MHDICCLPLSCDFDDLQDVVRKIEGVEKGSNDRPKKDVTIASSGTLAVEDDLYVDKE